MPSHRASARLTIALLAASAADLSRDRGRLLATAGE
jgi:hypothetical protein